MRQTDLGLNLRTRRTRERESLGQMDSVVPRDESVAVVAPYQGAQERPDAREGSTWHVAVRPGKRRALDKTKASIRAKVEHPLRVIKQQFGHVKLRYRGLVKNTAPLKTLLALSNLWMARQRLLAQLVGVARPHPSEGDDMKPDTDKSHESKKISFILFAVWLWALLPSLAQASLLLNLVDDETGQPIMRRSNGYEEPFRMRLQDPDRSVLLYGLSSQTLIRMKGERPPIPDGIGAIGEKKLLIGYRFQLQDSGRWVRITDWPYDALEKYTNTTDLGMENSPANLYKRAILKRLMSGDLLERQTWLAFQRGPEDCQMWGFRMLVMMDSDNQKVRWAKTYAVARKGVPPPDEPDDIATPCEQSNWRVIKSLIMPVFKSPDEIEMSAVDQTTDLAKRGGRAGFEFLVSTQTGDIIPGTGAPPGWKAVNVEELVRFKEAFFAKHRCPQYTPRLRQEARHDNSEFPDTPAGRCMTQRSHRYTDELRKRFLGEPLPPLPRLPDPVPLPR